MGYGLWAMGQRSEIRVQSSDVPPLPRYPEGHKREGSGEGDHHWAGAVRPVRRDRSPSDPQRHAACEVWE